MFERGVNLAGPEACLGACAHVCACRVCPDLITLKRAKPTLCVRFVIQQANLTTTLNWHSYNGAGTSFKHAASSLAHAGAFVEAFGIPRLWGRMPTPKRPAANLLAAVLPNLLAAVLLVALRRAVQSSAGPRPLALTHATLADAATHARVRSL